MASDHAALFAALAAPFPPHKVKKKPGRGRSGDLDYITARVVQERLDEVVGPANWQCEFREWRGEDTLCRLGLRIGDEWVWKEDGSDPSDIEATKGGFSGSFKRAAVMWGIGRDLYPETAHDSHGPPPGSPRAASSILPPVKAPPRAKVQQKAAQAVPGEPLFWREPIGGPYVGVRNPYQGMPWAEALDMDKGEFRAWVLEAYKEASNDIAAKERDPSPDEMRVKAAKVYLEIKA